MAATNYTPISLYYSTTVSAAPVAGNLVNGELAINITDGKLYYKDNGGNVQIIASKAAAAVTSGTSGGVPYYSSATTIASSAALAANALVIGGGAGAAPATTTTGTGVVTALGVNVGTAGAFVVNGGALGTPSSGTVTNLTGTASISINGTVGATTPNTGAFTTLSSSGALTVTDTTQSTSTSTGSIITSGGVGIAKALQVGGTITGLSTFQSSSGADLSLNANGANRDIIGKINGTEGFRYTGSTTNFGVTGTLSATGVGKINTALAATGNGLDVGGSMGLNDANRYKSVYFYHSGTGKAAITYDNTNNVLDINAIAGSTITVTPDGALSPLATFSGTGLAVTGYIQAQAAASQAKTVASAFNSGVAAANSAEMLTFAQAGTQRVSYFWNNSASRLQIQTLTSGHTIALAPDTGGTDVLVAKAAGVDVTGALSATGALTAGGSLGATVDIFEAISGSGTKFIGEFKNTNASSPNGISIYYSGASPNGTANEFLYLTDTGGLRMSTRSNGGIANYQANDVNLSDLTVKADFQQHDIAKAWDFGKRMRDAWGRFKYEDQTHDDWNSGYGAQLVQAAAGDDFPELVELTKWGERDLLTVYDSDLMHIMGAVTTELQYRSDDYESRIAALEARLKAIEKGQQ